MPTSLRDQLLQLQQGTLTVDEVLAAVESEQIENLNFARIDHDRQGRCGVPEVVYGGSKTPEQIVSILTRLTKRNGYALATRLKPVAQDAVQEHFPDALINRDAQTALCGTAPTPARPDLRVGVVAAGTSDLSVAEEALVTLTFAGIQGIPVYDVGVAGLHRLLRVRETLESCSVLVVIAGMEGALPTVVGGLVRCPVIAVPTSVGYGASFGGIAALLGMLNSCASGISVVNIDNGFGAGICASRIVQGIASAPKT